MNTQPTKQALKECLVTYSEQLVRELHQLVENKNFRYDTGYRASDVVGLLIEYELGTFRIWCYPFDHKAHIIADANSLLTQRNTPELFMESIEADFYKTLAQNHVSEDAIEALSNDLLAYQIQLFETWFADCWQLALRNSQQSYSGFLGVYGTIWYNDLATQRRIREDEIVDIIRNTQ